MSLMVQSRNTRREQTGATRFSAWAGHVKLAIRSITGPTILRFIVPSGIFGKHLARNLAGNRRCFCVSIAAFAQAISGKGPACRFWTLD